MNRFCKLSDVSIVCHNSSGSVYYDDMYFKRLYELYAKDLLYFASLEKCEWDTNFFTNTAFTSTFSTIPLTRRYGVYIGSAGMFLVQKVWVGNPTWETPISAPLDGVCMFVFALQLPRPAPTVELCIGPCFEANEKRSEDQRREWYAASLLEILSMQQGEKGTISEKHATLKCRPNEIGHAAGVGVNRLHIVMQSLDCEV